MNFSKRLKARTIKTILGFLLVGFSHSTWAMSNDVQLSDESRELDKIHNNSAWTNTLKNRYGVSEEKVNDFKEQGLQYSDIAIAEQLAKDTGKSASLVIRMHSDERKSWDDIARQLSIDPAHEGRVVADLRKELIVEQNNKTEDNK